MQGFEVVASGGIEAPTPAFLGLDLDNINGLIQFILPSVFPLEIAMIWG